MGPDPPPNPTRRSAQSRRAILGASIALVGELGYAKVTIEAIAQRAGVGKQTIYRWWPSKGAVMLEAATERLDSVVAFPNTGDVMADLRTQLVGIAELIGSTSFGSTYQGLLAAGQSDPELLEALFDRVIRPNIEGFTERLTLAQQNGEVRADADIHTLRDLLHGVIEYRMIHAMPIEPRHVDAVLDVTFHGVGATRIVDPPATTSAPARARRSSKKSAR